MQRNRRGLRKSLERLFGSKASARTRDRVRRRFEPLEPRLMLHGGHEIGLLHNGSHAANPDYNLNEFHIHANLQIYVDSQMVTIPQGVGEPPAGGADIHTHDATGDLHIHPQDEQSEFIHLGDFFEDWSAFPTTDSPSTIVLSDTQLFDNIADSDNSLRMFVNNSEVQQDFATYQIHDGDSITLVYGEGEANASSSLAGFAVGLRDAGVTLTGVVGSADLNRQAVLFGTAGNLLPFTPATTGATTWRFADGSQLEGFQTLQTLSQRSGVALPTNILSIQTNVGQIELELLVAEAPATVNNFLNYVNPRAGATQGRLVGTAFHRAADSETQTGTSEFVVQGGGFLPSRVTLTPNDLAQPTPTTNPPGLAILNTTSVDSDDPIPDERENGDRSNLPGTVTMAKNSFGATNEFFVNARDNTRLDSDGFTVFAVDLDYLNPDGSINPDSTFRRISSLRSFDLNPLFTPGFGQTDVFEDVPLIDTVDSEGELVSSDFVVIQSIDGSGTVSGMVFDDQDRDGVLDTGESGMGGFRVFSDLNGNGSFDDGEFSVMTQADGTYSLILPVGDHTIRQEAVGDFLQTATPINPLTVQIGRELTDVRFGVFELTAPGLVDLLPASDSGNSNVPNSNSDNITNRNNNGSGNTLQLSVGGVTNGATVRFFSDGTLLGQAEAANGTASITTNGSTILPDGPHSIIATQGFGTLQGPPSTPLTVTIDTIGPGAFSSAAPTSAIIDQSISYDAEVAQEGNGVSYSLTNAPAGATIDSSSGLLSWAPAANQLGRHDFTIIAADTANNTSTQQLSVLVTLPPVVVSTHKITGPALDDDGNVILDDDGNLVADPDSAEISDVNVGDRFFVHVFVADLGDDQRDPVGVFGFYEDILYDPQFSSAVAIHPSNNFRNGQRGEIERVNQNGTNVETGVVDELGAFGSSDFPLEPMTLNIFSVEFQAIRSTDVAQFTGDPADLLPSNDVLVYRDNDPVPQSQVSYGSAQLKINASFGANDDIFNFDEGTQNNLLTVLANDLALDGSNDNLTISGVQPVAGQAAIVGTVTIAADMKSLRYTPPDADFNGEVMFSYEVTDGADILQADVRVQIHPINDPPVAVNDTRDFERNSTDNLISVLDNDTDIDGDPRVTNVTQPSGPGTTRLALGGTGVIYTPGTGFVGSETFTYTIADAEGLTSQAEVLVTVKGAADDSRTVLEESQDNVFDVLTNDEGTGLTITDLGQVSTVDGVLRTARGGIVSITDSGTTVTYSRTPGDNFFGTDSFTYTARDDQGVESLSVVTVLVENTNDPPTAVDDVVNVTENTSNNPIAVLANDSNAPDPTGEPISVAAVDDNGTIGTVSLLDGVVSYTPPTSFPGTGLSTGTDTFSYTIGDGTGETDTAMVTVNVVEFVPGSLSGFVYIDANNNGLREPDEEGFDGVSIALRGIDGLASGVSLNTSTTSPNGAYDFNNLPPGRYVLSQTQPTGERNGFPIVDGKDTIGILSGQDLDDPEVKNQFTIDLTEGVHSTDNNFAELLGFTISGDVGGSNARFNNLTYEIYRKNADGSRIQPPVKTVQVVNGMISVDGLEPAEYEVVQTPQPFLSTPATGTSASTLNGNATGNQFTVGGRAARFITFADISNRVAELAQTGEFIHLAANSNGDGWYSFGNHYSQQFSTGQFMVMNDGEMLHLELTSTSGTQQMADIPMDDPRLRFISQENGFYLLEVRASSNQLGLQAMATPNAESESSQHEHAAEAAEAEHDHEHAAEAEASDHDHDHEHVAEATDHDHSAEAAEGESVAEHHDSDHAHVTSDSHSHDADHLHEPVLIQPVLGRPEPVAITNTDVLQTASEASTATAFPIDSDFAVLATTNVTPTITLTDSSASTVTQDGGTRDADGRGTILEEVVSEYYNESLYGSSSALADDDEDINGRAVDHVMEELEAEDLLEMLAFSAIA